MKTIDITFLILDLVEIIATYVLAKRLSVVYKKYKEKTLLSLNALTILSFITTFRTILIVLFVLLFITICELAYKINYYKNIKVEKVKQVNKPYELYRYEGQDQDEEDFANGINPYEVEEKEEEVVEEEVKEEINTKKWDD